MFNQFDWTRLWRTLAKNKFRFGDISGIGHGYMGTTTLKCQMGRKFLWHITIIINEFFFTFFYINKKKSIWFVNIFDLWFLMVLYVFCRISWTIDMTIFGKRLFACLCVCPHVCDKNFVAHVAGELSHSNLWNFVFSVVLT